MSNADGNPNDIAASLTLLNIPAAVAAPHGQLDIQNVAGVLKKVDDAGTATDLGAGGAGTVTSVAATASGLLAVAGTPTVAPTVGMATAATHTIIANVTGGTAVPTAASATAVTAILDAATTSLQGMMPASDKVTVNSLAARWESVQATFLVGKIPQLTEFQFACAANQPSSSPKDGATVISAHDGAIEGGGWSASTAVNSLVHTQSVVQLPKTGKWGIAWRGKFAASLTVTNTFVGFVNGAATHVIDFGTAPSTDATHWMARVGAGTAISTTVRDTSIHDFAATSDGTTITWYIDGVSILTAAASGANSDEPMYFWQYNTTHLDGIVTKYLIGYIAP